MKYLKNKIQFKIIQGKFIIHKNYLEVMIRKLKHAQHAVDYDILGQDVGYLTIIIFYAKILHLMHFMSELLKFEIRMKSRILDIHINISMLVTHITDS